MKQMSRIGLPGLVVLLVAAPALGVAYTELITSAIVKDGSGGSSHWSHVVDGQTSYHTINLSSAPTITKVSNINGVQSSATLYTPAQWNAVSGVTLLSNGHGFGIYGADLMWTDTSTDAIWKAKLDGSGIAKYVSKAQIGAFNGLGTASSGNGNTIAPSGEMTWFESSSDSILQTTGWGTMTTLVTEAQLNTLHGQGAGNASVVSGMTYDSAATLYWGSSTDTTGTDAEPGGIYTRTSGGTLGTALTAAEIAAVSGEPNDRVSFGDIFSAPDGNVYFYESREDNIMRFDPSNAASSLEIFISEAELLAGPSDNDNVVTLGWHDSVDGPGGFSALTFHTFKDVGNSEVSALYKAPEPATFGLLALGSLVVMRRRRR